MLGEIVDCLSIWEIAHRWHGHDPSRTDPDALPLEVQDTLRVITRKMWLHDLPSFSAAGVERRTHASLPNFFHWLEEQGIDPAKVNGEHPEALATLAEDEVAEDEWRPDGWTPPSPCNIHELRERYNDRAEGWVEQHNAAIDGFEDVFRFRRYDRAKLESVYLVRSAVRKMCQSEEIELPAFWFSEAERATAAKEPEQPEKTLRPNQIDKQLCQAVASTLWHLDPLLTISTIVDHPALRRFGNGGQYSKKTLREWVSPVDPRPGEAKRGRPRNKPKPG